MDAAELRKAIGAFLEQHGEDINFRRLTVALEDLSKDFDRVLQQETPENNPGHQEARAAAGDKPAAPEAKDQPGSFDEAAAAAKERLVAAASN